MVGGCHCLGRLGLLRRAIAASVPGLRAEYVRVSPSAPSPQRRRLSVSVDGVVVHYAIILPEAEAEARNITARSVEEGIVGSFVAAANGELAALVDAEASSPLRGTSVVAVGEVAAPAASSAPTSGMLTWGEAAAGDASTAGTTATLTSTTATTWTTSATATTTSTTTTLPPWMPSGEAGTEAAAAHDVAVSGAVLFCSVMVLRCCYVFLRRPKSGAHSIRLHPQKPPILATWTAVEGDGDPRTHIKWNLDARAVEAQLRWQHQGWTCEADDPSTVAPSSVCSPQPTLRSEGSGETRSPASGDVGMPTS